VSRISLQHLASIHPFLHSSIVADDDGSGERRKAYPAWRRWLRYAVTLPPVLAALAVILVIMSTVFTTQVRCSGDPTTAQTCVRRYCRRYCLLKLTPPTHLHPSSTNPPTPSSFLP